MAYFKRVEREQGQFIAINFSEQILPGTFEHAIDYIVDKKIDTTTIENRYKNDNGGAAAYSPKTMLKIIHLAYSHNADNSCIIIKYRKFNYYIVSFIRQMRCLPAINRH